MAWVVPVAQIASSILSQGKEAAARKRGRQNEIEMQALENKSAIYQGGRANGGYGPQVPQAPDKSDNGLGAAIQLLGAIGGGKGESASAEPLLKDEISKGLGDAIDSGASSGAYKLEAPSLLGDGAKENIDVPSAQLKMDDDYAFNPKEPDDYFTSRLASRFRI